MCGISGVVDLEQKVDPVTIQNMVTALRHRGPDGQATKQVKGAWLGHARLSVIDLVTGDQPMSDPAQRWWIVFNGEIYNYRELRRELEQEGILFGTTSDTEVILQSYIKYGESMLQRLNGQFAFAVWDQEEQTLFAARDRFGEKPFYYSVVNSSTFVFASEIKSVLASALVKPRMDQGALASFLCLMYIPSGETVYENVGVLKPGHALLWRNGQVNTFEYWQLPLNGNRLKVAEEDAILHIRHLVERAVERQMVADVPVGAFLSGGLDSSTTVALMSRFSDHPVKTFSVGFGSYINELPYASAVAKLYKTEHHEIQMDIRVAETLETLAHVFDEPFADSSNIPTYKISEFASKHVKVVLAGDGGDEIFGGYGWYRNILLASLDTPSVLQLIGLYLRYSRLLIQNRIGGGKQEEEIQAIRLINTSRQKRLRLDLWLRRAKWGNYFKPDQIHALFGNGTFKPAWMMDMPPASVSEMDRVSWFDFKQYLPGDILVKVDRAAMAHGLEVRAPFLDVELAEFVLSLPWTLRLKNSENKYLLKKACCDLWPPKVQARTKKQGFGSPLGAWLQLPDVKALLDRVFQPKSALNHVLPGVTQQRGQLREQQTWSILCLGLWLEKRSTYLL
jgi:asparagine synthase (glutamine-hydrolysing)